MTNIYQSGSNHQPDIVGYTTGINGIQKGFDRQESFFGVWLNMIDAHEFSMRMDHMIRYFTTSKLSVHHQTCEMVSSKDEILQTPEQIG